MVRAISLCLLFLGSCSRCSKERAHEQDGATPTFEVATPPVLSAPALRELSSFTGFGLPAGCKFDGALRQGSLPKGKQRFAAIRGELDSLSVAVADSGDRVTRAGLVSFGDEKVTPMPWALVDAPPLVERRSSGWFAAWSTEGDPSRVLGWTGGERATLMAEGDGVVLADAACDKDTCAVLTSIARHARLPGATITTTDGHHADIEPGAGETWQPLSLLGFRGRTAKVALSSGKAVAIWRVDGERASEESRVETPFGAYDAVGESAPWIVAAGASPDRPCGTEEFPLTIFHGKDKFVIRTPAPPESLVAHPLGDRALVAWVAPVSCQLLERRVVYLTLLSPGDAGVPSPMAVTDATGFALTTKGDRFRLWLLSGTTLTELAGRC